MYNNHLDNILWDLIDHLRCYLDSYQALRGRILASCDPDDIHNSPTTTCQQYIEQLPPRHQTREAGHQTQRDTSVSSSSTSSSSTKNRQPHLQVRMIYIADDEEEESSPRAITHHHPQPPRPRAVWHLDEGPATSHLEYYLSDSKVEDAHQSWRMTTGKNGKEKKKNVKKNEEDAGEWHQGDWHQHHDWHQEWGSQQKEHQEWHHHWQLFQEWHPGR